MTPDNTTVIHLLAGQRPDGQLIFEDVQAENAGDGCYRLLASPLFARGAAKGDLLRLQAAGRFDVEQYGGNLCIRVLAKHDIDRIRSELQAELPSLGGELEYHNARMLALCVPVATGFSVIEAALNKVLQGNDQALWQYANVYDPVDGETPLNWWHDFLAR